MPVELAPDDQISRCVIYPRFFRDRVHVDELLWQFERTAPDGASHQSGVLRRMAPEDTEVHRIGCGIAAIQNERSGSPPPGPKRRYYCGFRTARYGDLPLQDEGYILVVTNDGENGEKAHLDFALTITIQGSKAAKNNRKTDAGLALAEHFGPIARHRCDCDCDDPNHPFADENGLEPPIEPKQIAAR
ncbi:hypothetical protein ACYCVF_33620 [Bradyrhizobium sp. 1.29L]